MKFVTTPIGLILLWLLISCIDEIDIPLSNDSILVIDGLITDEPGLHKIRIARSYSFNENPVFSLIDPLVLGATIEIHDDNDNVYFAYRGKERKLFHATNIRRYYW